MISLPVKYRPETWDEVVGQTTIVKILKKQVETGNVKNAYIFSGGSGDGKTTLARIFGKALDGEIIEIDAASNNGVDNIRNIIEDSQERSLSHKYKVYILDEAHMLSNSAYASLLKTLEEPPKYTIYILCTTDPQKIPETILNRTQRYNFSKLSVDDILKRLIFICEQENYKYEKDALLEIASLSNGSMREAISLLGQVADYSCKDIDMFQTSTVIESQYYSKENFFLLVDYLLDGKEGELLSLIEKIYSKGTDLKVFMDGFLKFILNISKYIIFQNITFTDILPHEEAKIKNLINFENPSYYYNFVIDKLMELKSFLKNEENEKEIIEIYLLQIARCQK